MNRPGIRCALACTLLTIASVALAARVSAQAAGALSGAVVDATGSPVAAAKISIEPGVEIVTHTDTAGRFSVAGLRDGTYNVAVESPGFTTLHTPVSVADGTSAPLHLALAVEGLSETVVVSGRAGPRDLEETPFAVTSLSAEDLEREGATRPDRFAVLAPSVTFSQNSGFAQLSIRGIGSNIVFAGSDPGSAIYVDGVYLARPAMLPPDVLDLDHVEVLRGPQGTLYGRNAVGGALSIFTRPPENDLEASASITAGNFHQGRASLRVGGPLKAGRLLASASVLRSYERGTVNDLEHPDHPLGGDDVSGGRAQLRAIFGPRSDLLVSADYSRQAAAPLTYARVLALKPGFTALDVPGGLHNVRTSAFQTSRVDQGGVSARLVVPVGARVTATNLAAARGLDYHVTADGDITQLNLVTSQIHETQHQVSDDLTLTGAAARVQWLGGASLFTERDHQPTRIDLTSMSARQTFDPDVHASSAAVLGQATVRIAPRLSAIGGVRYTRERKTMGNEVDVLGVTPAMTITRSASRYVDALSDAAWTPKAALDVAIRDRTRAYVSATRGFKSGGFNASSASATGGYAPEFAWSYEAGVKTALGDRARLDVAAFHTAYSNLQVQVALRPGVLDISNAASATIRGVEIESSAQLSRQWQAGVQGVWLDARYGKYTAIDPNNMPFDASGHRLNNAPEYSSRAWLEWSGALGWRPLSLGGDTQWQSEVFFHPLNDAVMRQGAYALVDVNAAIAPPGRRWAVRLYARNLLNRDYINGAFATPPPAYGGRPGAPREVAVTFSVHR